MNCPTCGAPDMVESVQDVAYDGCALEGVTLMGVGVRDCTACGDRLVSIRAIEGLFRALTRLVIDKPGRLEPGEVRFLRKYLGWSGKDFAEMFGVTAETVSRWENGTRKMNPAADRLLRMCAAQLRPAQAYPLDHLREVARPDAPRKQSYRVTRRQGSDWQSAPP